MSDPGIYTIGWICAITTKFVAARAFLDEQHDAPLSISQHDNNCYSLGRMGRHNVAIAALPKSEYGTTAAATVARDMVHSFPNLKVRLMVGIGGGVPSKTHDIRLGDIVVGTRDINAGKGGVVQYDYGKTIQDREFSMTGSLNQPSQSLLTAVSSLEARHMMEGHDINGKIERVLEKYPRLKRSHHRPPVTSDRLCLPHITHPQTDFSNECSAVCGGDQSQVVMRADRGVEDDNPAVHYGLIASGNRLMKDANIRDQLSKQTGALCFEMEVAGLMNHFPCLVIRGICDYSDTHKNKEWQGFAAMTAAAYTRDLLEEVSTAVVNREDGLAKAIKSLETSQSWQKKSIQEANRTASYIRTSQRHTDLRRWLSPPNSSTNADSARIVRQEGTGSWIFDEPSFQLWRSGFRQHIWLYGLSGSGKTVLSTTIFDRLKKEDVQCLLQFYFDFRDPKKQTLDAMLRGLLYQLHLSTEYEFEHELGIALGLEGCVPLSTTAINSDIQLYVEHRFD
ncbi:hypothetical protein CGCVW01_v014154 [Colletotrichum viniferum]|nr:hypothetical protein CGCVW01_v014154 [Colletotrichum viniferum]